MKSTAFLKASWSWGVIGVVLCIAIVTFIRSRSLEPDGVGAKTLTDMRLGLLKAHVVGYFRDTGKWPSLIELKTSISNEYSISYERQFIDGWGDPILYESSEARAWRGLRSLGPNKVDDAGTNDDIVLLISP